MPAMGSASTPSIVGTVQHSSGMQGSPVHSMACAGSQRGAWAEQPTKPAQVVRGTVQHSTLEHSPPEHSTLAGDGCAWLLEPEQSNAIDVPSPFMSPHVALAAAPMSAASASASSSAVIFMQLSPRGAAWQCAPPPPPPSPRDIMRRTGQPPERVEGLTHRWASTARPVLRHPRPPRPPRPPRRVSRGGLPPTAN